MLLSSESRYMLTVNQAWGRFEMMEGRNSSVSIGLLFEAVSYFLQYPPINFYYRSCQLLSSSYLSFFSFIRKSQFYLGIQSFPPIMCLRGLNHIFHSRYVSWQTHSLCLCLVVYDWVMQLWLISSEGYLGCTLGQISLEAKNKYIK